MTTNSILFPEKFWHCAVKFVNQQEYSIVNDLTFQELEQKIINPWKLGKTFTISGRLIRSSDAVESIKISHTEYNRLFYVESHNQRMAEQGIGDYVTNRSLLPVDKGTDYTYDLLFSGVQEANLEPDIKLIEQLCKRLPQAARVLAIRSRVGKSGYTISDEYDVQDLLHALLRGYLKYSVQEDTLPKVAGAKSSRVDISIEELGVLIEIKYVSKPEDQKRLFEEYSQDLVLYAQWSPLKSLIYLIYNSADLRDAEAFEKLSSTQEINGKRFNVNIVLA
ncbi:MAG: hypothetical protein WAQ53_04930 [Thiofilum sp.]|uniref:PD-(D/E)XK nuclease domain-containing protein n=1 Tax=Thiofilum sp. TaxID=2212733 RepID=UPI0025E517AF|nr:hypothetical protein [Thiofilum sp.]MBK8452909.1 hypothetical protein [Thiofilum sp.]